LLQTARARLHDSNGNSMRVQWKEYSSNHWVETITNAKERDA
ncbi:hypothetical protein T09_15479, partial [Trichinella sp. T9]